MSVEHVDVLIVGAGISGICAAYYLQTRCPQKSFAILEGRDTIGGTWDLFRYPGIRSDSDMYTLGFSFNPWQEDKAIAEGGSILNYICTTAEKFNINQHIRFNHYVTQASWSNKDAQWTVQANVGDDKKPMTLTCNFLYTCSGYYDYDEGYTPHWDSLDQFEGDVIHPQHWDETYDYSDKNVVIIGSGATAVTLAPAMSDKAKHITILQRSPTYIASMPSEDAFAKRVHRFLPAGIANRLTRWNSILFQIMLYRTSRKDPQKVRDEILNMAREELGDDFDVDTHLSPTYNPWDQRLCLIPDSDLFHAINAGKVSMVTNHIDQFTPTGIKLQSGAEIPADLIITATGLKIKLMGGIQFEVDGQPVDFGKTITYKGLMFSGVPNMINAIGYINASWTLKAELIAEYACRLLKYMDKHHYAQCTPDPQNISVSSDPIINLSSGYIQRSIEKIPKQGTQKPWTAYQNYIRDMVTMRFSRIDDDALTFKKRQATQ